MKKLALIVCCALLGATLVSCGKKVPLGADQKDFAGKWVAGDGTYVTIYFDGGGDVKMSNTSITGGSTTIAKDTITIGMGPIKKEFKITARPAQAGGKWVLGLDGVSYTKE